MKLDTAKVHKGKAIVAYVGDQAVDSEGNVIEGAPKPPKDTEPSQQLGGRADMNAEERSASIMASAFAKALAAASGKEPIAPAADTSDDDEGTDSEESDELPPLADMPAHLESITDVDELKALKRQDTRKGGKQLIQARIDALKGAE
jgi:hypothetical protein